MTAQRFDATHGAHLLAQLRSAIFDDAELHTVALRKGDPRLVLLADDEHVVKARAEGVASRILDVNDLERAWMLLPVSHDADAANIVTAGDHDSVTSLELDEVQNLASLQVDADAVMRLDGWVWVADSATIVSDGVRDTLETAEHLLDTAQLVGSLLLRKLVHDETAVGSVEQTEVLLRLLNLHDIHVTSRVEHVRAHLAVNLDETLHDNHLALTVGESILETVAQHDDEWKALAQLVRACGRLWSPAALELVQHPVGWGEAALQVLDDAARHGCNKWRQSRL